MRSPLSLCFLLFFPVECARAAPVATSPVATSVSLSVRLNKSMFGAGEAVDALVTLSNASAKPVALGFLSGERCAFDFELRDERGELVPRTLAGAGFFASSFAAFRDGRVSLAPKGRRTFPVRLSQLFDLSAGGRFSLRVSRALPGFSGANTATVRASQVRFEIERAPFARLDASAAPLSVRAKYVIGVGAGGEIERFRVGDEGALSPAQRAAAVVPRGMAIVAAREGKFVYVVRDNTIGPTKNGGFAGRGDGAIFAFETGENAVLKPLGAVPLPDDFFTVRLDAARARLVLFSAYQHGQGYKDGGRAFLVGNDGRLQLDAGFQLDGTQTLAFSPDGRLAFEANFPVSAFRVAPDGHFSRVTLMGWRPREGGAKNVWVSPDGWLLLVEVEVQTRVENGHAVSGTTGGALFRVHPDAAPVDLLERVPGLFFDHDARGGALSIKPIGFDASGRFVLAHNGRGDLLCFAIDNPLAPRVVSRFAAQQRFGWNSPRGQMPMGVVFGDDKRTFYTAGSGLVRAWRLGEGGEIEALGAPVGNGAQSITFVSAPLFVARSGVLSAQFEREVVLAGESAPLEVRAGAPCSMNVQVVRERAAWELRAPAENAPILNAGRGAFPLAVTVAARLDLARAFDLSRPGFYRVRVSDGTAPPLELRLEVRDPAPPTPFQPIFSGNPTA